MVRVPGRPATARGAQRQQHRLRLYRRAAAGVRAGRRRALRLRRRRAAGPAQRGDLRGGRLADPRRGGPARQEGRAAEGLELELPAAGRAQQGRPALRRDPSRLSSARRRARRLRERRRGRLGGLGSLLRGRAEFAEGAHLVGLHRAHGHLQLLRGHPRLRRRASRGGGRGAAPASRDRPVGQRASRRDRRHHRAQGGTRHRAGGNLVQARAVRRGADRRADRRLAAGGGRRVLRREADSAQARGGGERLARSRGGRSAGRFALRASRTSPVASDAPRPARLNARASPRPHRPCRASRSARSWSRWRGSGRRSRPPRRDAGTC